MSDGEPIGFIPETEEKDDFSIVEDTHDPEAIEVENPLMDRYKQIFEGLERIEPYNIELEAAEEAIGELIGEMFSEEEQERLGEGDFEVFSETYDRLVNGANMDENERERLVQTIVTDPKVVELGVAAKMREFLISDQITNLRSKNLLVETEKRKYFEEIYPEWSSLVGDLKNKVDYKRLVDDSFSKNQGGGASEVIDHLDTIDRMAAINTEDSLKGYYGVFGLFGEDRQAEEMLAVLGEYFDADLGEETDSVIDTTDLVNIKKYSEEILQRSMLLAKYRGNDLHDEVITARRMIWTLAATSDSEGNGLRKSLLDNRAALSAFSQKAQETVIEWKELDLVASEEGVPGFEPDFVSNLDWRMEGLDEVDGMELLIRESDVRRYICSDPVNISDGEYKYLFPARFVEGITEVDFVNDDPYPLNADQVRDDQDRKFYKNAREDEIYETLVHEIFERVSLDLTYDEIVDWEKAMQADSDRVTSVTWYGKFGKYNPDEVKSWEKEDFCETGMLYVSRPIDLYRVSPARFRYMITFFADNLPEEYREEYKKEMVGVVRKNVFGKTIAEKKQVQRELTSHEDIPREEIKVKENEKDVSVITGTFVKAVEGGGGHKITVVSPFYIPERNS